MRDLPDSSLYNYLLTQKSVKGVSIYDELEKIIAHEIEQLRLCGMNAKIINQLLLVDGKLVPMQIYLVRENGFSPTPDYKFGTNPSAYNVQLRFPYGMGLKLGDQEIDLPSGEFKSVLKPYLSAVKDKDYQEVKDNVQHSNKAHQVLTNPAVTISTSETELRIEVRKQTLQVRLNSPKQESNAQSPLDAYAQKLNTEGVSPFFNYSAQNSDKAPFDAIKNELNKSAIGKALVERADKSKSQPFVFNLSIINGMTLLTESGIPLTRLRDYQLELFKNCMEFAYACEGQEHGQSAKISMGVGAGKTFSLFTLLQQLKLGMKENKLNTAPPYCMAPDEAIAKVISQSIDRQGRSTGVTANTVDTKHGMPDANFLKTYKALAEGAVKDTETLDTFLNDSLQQSMVDFCKQARLHPNSIINGLGNLAFPDNFKRTEVFKNSMDVKRLLLKVEGYNTIIKKTGMLSLTAAKELLEELKSLESSLQGTSEILLLELGPSSKTQPETINYNQTVNTPKSLQGPAQFNPATVTSAELTAMLKAKYAGKASVRDVLMKIACMKNKEAAIILANAGGLGNTYTDEELDGQIARFAPVAAELLNGMASKSPQDNQDHMLMYYYLNEIFSNIPPQFSYSKKADFRAAFYKENIEKNCELVGKLKAQVEKQISELRKAKDIPGVTTEVLLQYGINPEASAIEAANQLAGVASLQITGTANQDNANLLLTHIPVFTPESFAAYISHLASLEGQPKANFQKEKGIYRLTDSAERITKEDIQLRIKQVLQAIMLADEVHHPKYDFLFDSNSEAHKQINTVTLRFFQKPFATMLPNRLGMSGTIDKNVASKAFPGQLIYNLSTQRMIANGLVKDIHPDTRPIPQKLETYARQIVVDYFLQNSRSSPQNKAVDLFALSKGLLFSKLPDSELNKLVEKYFNLLIVSNPSPEESSLQNELFAAINEARKQRAKTLELTTQALELSPASLQNSHREAFKKNLMALYLEFVLSKSTAPKECSDLIGLQNRLEESNCSLVTLDKVKENMEVETMLSLLAQVDPKTLTPDEIHNFLNKRITDEAHNHVNASLREHLKMAFTNCQNNYRKFQEALNSPPFENFPLTKLISDNKSEFEAGTTLALLGTKDERTGYSHEPVGIVVDLPGNLNAAQSINGFLKFQPKDADSVSLFYFNLKQWAANSFGFDEKNQAGGRALRTPYGKVKYLEYQSDWLDFLKTQPEEVEQVLSGLTLETPFESIFTDKEEAAHLARDSVHFNRSALKLLDKPYKHYKHFVESLSLEFKAELEDEKTKARYQDFIKHRLPLLWSIKYQPDLAAAYFNSHDLAATLTKAIALETSEVITEVPEVENETDLRIQALGRICSEYETHLFQALSKSTQKSIGNSYDTNRLRDTKNRFGLFQIYKKDKDTLGKLIAVKELQAILNNPDSETIERFKTKLNQEKHKLEQRRVNLMLAICTLGLSYLISTVFAKVDGVKVTKDLMQQLDEPHPQGPKPL